MSLLSNYIKNKKALEEIEDEIFPKSMKYYDKVNVVLKRNALLGSLTLLTIFFMLSFFMLGSLIVTFLSFGVLHLMFLSNEGMRKDFKREDIETKREQNVNTVITSISTLILGIVFFLLFGNIGSTLSLYHSAIIMTIIMFFATTKNIISLYHYKNKYKQKKMLWNSKTKVLNAKRIELTKQMLENELSIIEVLEEADSIDRIDYVYFFNFYKKEIAPRYKDIDERKYIEINLESEKKKILITD